MKNCKTGSRKIRDTSVVSRLNMKQKVLITGGTGLLGVNWALAIKKSFDVVIATHTREISLDGVEVLNIALDSSEQVIAVLAEQKPVIVIHTVGLTNVEQCEENLELARKVNVDLARNVATACSELGIKLVHISTDHLFSGAAPMCREADDVFPVNNYARTKADAELAVLDACPDALVIRTNFYGWGTSYRKSFSDHIISSLRQGMRVTLYRDVYYTPIIIDELVSVVHSLLDINSSGVVHVAGNERVSKYEFGMMVAEVFGLDSSLIDSGYISDRDDLVQRPKDMSLDNSKVIHLIDRKPDPTVDQIKKLKDQELDGTSARIGSL